MKLTLKLPLNEDLTLYKGIFWIVDLENIENNKNYCFLIPTTVNGEVDYNPELNAKNNQTYNHEKTWLRLPSKLTHNKPYNYYPRGRVEIANSKADIYVNPNIFTDEVKRFIINQFNLIPHNGIKKVRMVADGSNHYQCYLDY